MKKKYRPYITGTLLSNATRRHGKITNLPYLGMTFGEVVLFSFLGACYFTAVFIVLSLFAHL